MKYLEQMLASSHPRYIWICLLARSIHPHLFEIGHTLSTFFVLHLGTLFTEQIVEEHSHVFNMLHADL